MRRGSWVPLLLSLAVAREASAEGWDWKSHARTTWEVARSGEFGFEIPEDVARVMAIGSMAPDYFNASTQAAHSQNPGPRFKDDGRLLEEPERAENRRRQAFEEASAWHEFYLGAAVEAMKRGQRERAAFLLGFALHNREEFAMHRGKCELVLVGMKSEGHDPRTDTGNLNAARSFASIDIDRFRSEIGPDAWQLFTGRALKGGEVPAPLLNLAPGLAGWDPSVVYIPAPGPAPPMGTRTDIYLKRMQERLKKLGAHGAEVFQACRAQAEGWAWGFLPHQRTMVWFLDLDDLRNAAGTRLFPRAEEFLAMPHVKSEKDFEEFVFDPELYFFGPGELLDPAKFARPGEIRLLGEYAKLTPAERESLSQVNWNDMLAEELNEKRRQLERAREELAQAKRLQLKEMRWVRAEFHRSVGRMNAWKAAAARVEARRARDAGVAASGPPTVNAIPKEMPNRDTGNRVPEGGFSQRDPIRAIDPGIDLKSAEIRLDNLAK